MPPKTKSKPQPRTSGTKAKATVKAAKDIIIPYDGVQWRPEISNIKFHPKTHGMTEMSFCMKVDVNGSPGGYHYKKKNAGFHDIIIPQIMNYYHHHLDTAIQRLFTAKNKAPKWRFNPYGGLKRCKNAIQITFYTFEEGSIESFTPSGKADDMTWFLEDALYVRYGSIYFPIAKSYLTPSKDREQTDQEYAKELERFEKGVASDLSRFKEYFGWVSHFKI